jgi:hypothetical protein
MLPDGASCSAVVHAFYFVSFPDFVLSLAGGLPRHPFYRFGGWLQATRIHPPPPLPHSAPPTDMAPVRLYRHVGGRRSRPEPPLSRRARLSRMTCTFTPRLCASSNALAIGMLVNEYA